jgi:hypothetical protein
VRRIVMSGLAAAVAVLGFSVPALAGTAGHSVVAGPASAATAFLSDVIGPGSAVSCASATSCFAVGEGLDSKGHMVPAAESLHAGTWKTVSTAKAPGISTLTSVLNFVSCKAATYCLAVGQYLGNGTTPYVMTWNGTALTPVVKLPIAHPDYIQEIGPVSCTAVNSCIVFGSGEDPAATTPGNVVGAVYAWTWNGSKWSLTKTDVPGNELPVINAARCFSLTSCVLAGATNPIYGATDTLAPLLATWNGKTLIPMKPSVPSGMKQAWFVNVSCVATTSCAATGISAVGNDESAFLDVTGGHGWNLTKWGGPSGTTTAVLDGISCVSRSSCVAVGELATAKASVAAALTWNGTKWAVTKVPGPGTGKASLFSSVSCPAAGNCTAIGQTGKPAAEVGQLAGHWNGSTWKLAAA